MKNDQHSVTETGRGTWNQWQIKKNLKGAGGGRQFISPRPHLSQMNTTIDMPLTRKKTSQ